MTDHHFPEDAVVARARTYGAQLKVNPYTALLEEVQWRAGHVAAIRERLGAGQWDDLFVYDADGNQQASPLLKRYDQERLHLDRACKLAIDAGISERYVQLAELQGATLYRVLSRALERATQAAGITGPALEAFRQAFGPALRQAFEQEARPSAERLAVGG